jgi:hypothetical protein
MPEEKQMPSYVAQFPEEFKTNEVWKDYPEMKGVLQDFITIREEMKTRVKLPNEKSSPEERAAFYKALDVPGKPEEYELNKPNTPEGLAIPKEHEEWFRKMCHELHIPKGAAKALYDKSNEKALAALTAKGNQDRERVTAAENAMKGEWKENYQKNIETANFAVSKFGGDSIKAFLQTEVNGVLIGNHPDFVKFCYSIGKEFKEGSVPASGVTGQTGIKYKEGEIPYTKSPELYKNRV